MLQWLLTEFNVSSGLLKLKCRGGCQRVARPVGRRDMSIATSSRLHVISDNVGAARLSDRELQSVPTSEKKNCIAIEERSTSQVNNSSISEDI